MRLLYCFVEFKDSNGFRGLDKIEVCFSSKDAFSFDRNTNTLRRSDRVKPLPDNFWSNGSGGTNIYNVNVIAGANGSGKTTVIYYIIDLLNYIYHDFGSTLDDNDRRTRFDPSGDRCILVFEDGGELLLLDMAQGGEPVKTEGFDTSPSEGVLERLRRTKLINMTNTLNQRDYELHIGKRQATQIRNKFVYCCTLGTTIGPNVSFFFLNEVYKQVKFVFDERVNSKCEISDLRIPTALRIILRNDSFKEYFDTVGHENLKELPLAKRLGMLCAASFLDNVAYAKDLKLNGDDKVRLWRNIPKGYSFSEQIELIENYFNAVVVSGADDGTLRVWDIRTGDCLRTMEGHVGGTRCVSVTEDGQCVSGSGDGTLRVWDIRTGDCLRTIKGHSSLVRCVAVTEDGLCVSGSRDNTMRVWNIRTGECLHTLEGQNTGVRCVAVTDDRLCVSGSWDRTLRVWDIRAGECLRTIKGRIGEVNCVAVTDDGLCVSGSENKTLRIWSIRNGACLGVLIGHTDSVTCVAVSKDGLCISGSNDNTLRVWDIHTRECLRTMEGHNGSVNCVTVIEDGLCISGSEDGTQRVWDIRTGECLRILEGHTGTVYCVDTFYNPTGDSAVKMLKDDCNSYVHYLDANEGGLFSKFNKVENVSDKIYELPIENVKKGGKLYNQLGEFIQKYMATCKPYYTLDFDWGLSSGEENMLRIFTWLHHIFPQDTTGEYVIRNNENDSDGGGTTCDSVIIFMDEADLTLHPEWQRRLIYNLTSFIPQIYPAAVAKDIQLVLTTHSPLLLGDIPRENVMYLSGKGENQPAAAGEPSETFGQNIHTILKDSFFLSNGTVGEFAAMKINALAAELEELSNPKSGRTITEKELTRLRRSVDLVAPGILRGKLEAMLRSAELSNGSKLQSLLEQVKKLSEDDQKQFRRKMGWEGDNE